MKNIKELQQGTVKTGDEEKAKKLAKQGIDVELTTEQEENLNIYTTQETKSIAKEVAVALNKALEQIGNEVVRGKLHRILENQFYIEIEFKNGNVGNYEFYIDKQDSTLHLIEEGTDLDLGEVGVKQSGEPLVNKTLVQDTLVKYWIRIQENSTILKFKKLTENIFFETILKGVKRKTLLEQNATLETATEEMLNRFPKLKSAILKLMTKDYGEFLNTIDYISPRPTTFRINLKNNQNFILKWTGQTFEAQILGKKYYINKLSDFQQALDKLSILYRENPVGNSDEEEEGSDNGDDNFSLGGEEKSPESPSSNTDGGEEEPPADLGGEELEFSTPGEEPE